MLCLRNCLVCFRNKCWIDKIWALVTTWKVSVFSHHLDWIQSKYRKILPRRTPNTDIVHPVTILMISFFLYLDNFINIVKVRLSSAVLILFLAFSGINPSAPNAPFLYPLKSSVNLKVFWCFQGLEKECIGKKWDKIYCLLWRTSSG